MSITYFDTSNQVLPAIGFYRPVSEANGHEARRVNAELGLVRSSFHESHFFGENRYVALQQLEARSREASVDNWDGEGAKKIKKGSYCLVQMIIGNMPRDGKVPEVSVDPDGEVALEWYSGKGRRVSLSVSDKGRMAFAWIIGGERGYGAAQISDEVPETVGGFIRRVYA